jgi:hypothetical protein
MLKEFCLLGYNRMLSVDFQRTTRRYIPEGRILRNHRCENLKSQLKCRCLCHNIWAPSLEVSDSVIHWSVDRRACSAAQIAFCSQESGTLIVIPTEVCRLALYWRHSMVWIVVLLIILYCNILLHCVFQFLGFSLHRLCAAPSIY